MDGVRAGVKAPHLAAASAVAAVFVALVTFASTGVRGTDSYWYVADVERLAAGESWTTNNIFPLHVMQNEQLARPRFLHNIPHVYFVWPAARLLGAYRGWIATNVAASLITALMVGWLLTRAHGPWFGVLGFSWYLLLPLTLWQTTQPVVEATLAPVLGLVMLLYAGTLRDAWRWPLLLLAATLAYYGRESFLPLLLLVPLACCRQREGDRRTRVLTASGLLLLALAAIALKQPLFPRSTQVPLPVRMNMGVPGVSDNMAVYFGQAQGALRAWHLWWKLRRGITQQLLPPLRSQLFYLPFNLLAVGSVWGCLRGKNPAQRRSSNLAVVLLVIHVLTICLMQNQFRYMLPVLPVVLVAGLWKLGDVRWLQPRVLSLLAGSTLALAAADLPLAAWLHQAGRAEQRLAEGLRQQLRAIVGAEQTVVMEAGGGKNYLLAGYALRPARVVFVRASSPPDLLDRIDRTLRPDWLLCPAASPLRKHYPAGAPAERTELPAPFRTYRLYRLRPAQVNTPPPAKPLAP